MGMSKAAKMMMAGRSSGHEYDKDYNHIDDRRNHEKYGERYREERGYTGDYKDRYRDDYYGGYRDNEKIYQRHELRNDDYGYGDRREIRAGGTFWMDDPYSRNPEFDRKNADRWASKMKNEDGTTGSHWTMEQTNSVAKEHGIKFEHITDYCWWITMNMMYSDYYAVAVKHNCNTTAFYADMAKAFLFDKDAKSPREKISAYYEYIVM